MLMPFGQKGEIDLCKGIKSGVLYERGGAPEVWGRHMSSTYQALATVVIVITAAQCHKQLCALWSTGSLYCLPPLGLCLHRPSRALTTVNSWKVWRIRSSGHYFGDVMPLVQ